MPRLQARLASGTGPIGNWAQEHADGFSPRGLGGQFLVGLLLGAVWSPCVGPTLGAASVLAARAENLFAVAITMLAFGVGATLPLLAIGLMSREALGRWRNRLLAAGRSGKAVMGALNRNEHSPLPHAPSIDWKWTIGRNLKNYQPSIGTIIPEKVYFFSRAQRSNNWTVIVCMDQSGSMAESVVYGSVTGSIFASLPALDTRVIAFDTEVVDLTEQCGSDPVGEDRFHPRLPILNEHFEYHSQRRQHQQHR